MEPLFWRYYPRNCSNSDTGMFHFIDENYTKDRSPDIWQIHLKNSVCTHFCNIKNYAFGHKYVVTFICYELTDWP